MRYFYIALFMLLFCFSFKHAYAQNINLQEIIDEAEGDSVTIPEGEYEANLIIHRPIKILGEGKVVIKPVHPNEPIITIENTEQVSISGIKLRSPKTAILVKNAKSIWFSDITIENVDSGIELYNTNNAEIKNLFIKGNNKHYGNKGNGIAVFNSRNILVEGNDIEKVQDGVYIENVKDIIVRKNSVQNSRYGTHFMYSENAEAQENTYTKNVTGLMVMMTNNVNLLKNEISYQDGFNGTGITLYDVHGVNVNENEISGNRVAISLQKTIGVKIQSNKFQMNQTAIESIQSDKSNNALDNYFVGNLVNVRSDSIGITLQKNYFDDYSGIDLDDDGVGEEPYAALQSFGQWMVRKPVYQYYVEAPSVVLLNEIDKATNKSEQRLLVDKTPLTDFHTKKERNTSMNLWQLAIGLLLVISCLVIWRRSVLR